MQSGFLSLSHRLKQKGTNPICVCVLPFISAKSVTTTRLSSSRQIHLFDRNLTIRISGMSFSHSESNQDGPSSPSLAAAAFSSTHASAGNPRKVNYCQQCGGKTKHEVPDGDEKIRPICTVCGRIAYENPKMVVGCLIEHEDKVLLCKRNIQPSHGRWTLPAGYMEMGESATEGAMRETWEEANAEVEILLPFAQLDIPLIGQTYIIFLAKLKGPHFSPGDESSECRLFAFDDIPFDELAFSSMLVTLQWYIADKRVGKTKFHYGIINKRPGTSPSEIRAYTLDKHMEL